MSYHDSIHAITDRPAEPRTTAPAELRQVLPRLTKRVFTDLALWMSGLGLVMGLAFPFFVVALGVPEQYVLTPRFFVATIGAGLVVGATNQFLSRVVVRSRLQFMRSKMSNVEMTLRSVTYADDADACTPERCSIPVDSDDELGAAAASFNHLVEALAASQRATQAARRFAMTLSSHIEIVPLVDAAFARSDIIRQLHGVGALRRPRRRARDRRLAGHRRRLRARHERTRRALLPHARRHQARTPRRRSPGRRRCGVPTAVHRGLPAPHPARSDRCRRTRPQPNRSATTPTNSFSSSSPTSRSHSTTR